ncbi:MAG TPA: winged helix-turn-helix domain-containing protein [Bryobacteraceae bacterium]|jgi:tetratricopeptide (TPR) repeat protein|nr:winged helix-turn-helix domain-containing protein [Bryobacteraceae bacterium]
MTSGLDEPVALGPFRVNLATTRVVRDGVDLGLRPQAFRALRVLIQNPGRLVDYEQMIREAWDGVQVSRHTVAVTIGEVKQVLGEYGGWINCQPKFGYRLEIPQSEVLIRRGWHFWNQYSRVGYENALRCFEEAAQYDSADFRAWEGISSTYLMLASFVMRAPRDLHQPFLDAHGHTVAICGLTWQLRLDSAYARFVFDHDFVGAEGEMLQLQRERPNSAHVYIRLAMVYLASGRLEEARALMPPALRADALLAPLTFIGILLRLYCREFDAAVNWATSNLDLHPNSQVGRTHLAEALEYSNRFEEAQIQYERASSIAETPLLQANQARFLARIGRTAEASAMLEDLRRIRTEQYLDAYHVALILDALGRRDEAFEELERACDERSYAMLFIKVDAKADALRSDPRFAGLLSKVFRAEPAAESYALGQNNKARSVTPFAGL